jgi:hypothetical protein
MAAKALAAYWTQLIEQELKTSASCSSLFEEVPIPWPAWMSGKVGRPELSAACGRAIVCAIASVTGDHSPRGHQDGGIGVPSFT